MNLSVDMHASMKPSSPLQKALNQVLLLDEQARNALLKYAGNVIAIELNNTGKTIYIHITNSGIELGEPASGVPDITVRGTPSQLLAYLMAMKRGEPGKSGTIEIAGNIALAQKILHIVSEIDLDWEDKLSEWVGDSIAHSTGNVVRKTFRLFRHAGYTLRTDISEYLRYESDILPDRTEINEFNSSVDELRNDVERLKLRINRVRQARDQA